MTGEPHTIGEYLKAARRQRRYSLRALEAISGVNNSTVKRVEDGFITVPTPDVLLALINALELDICTAVKLIEPYDRLCTEVMRHTAKHGKEQA